MTAAAAPPIPPMPPVEQYGAAMARFTLAAMRHAAPPNPDAPRIVMYLTPWYRQGAAWFAVGLGIALATRAGARVEFMLNDMPYPSIHPHELNEIAALDAFCRQFEALIPFHRLSSFYAAPDPSRIATIERVVKEALRIDIRHRVGRGTLPRSQAAAFPSTALTSTTHIVSALDRFMALNHYDVVFCPGGAANGTYAVYMLAEAYGMRFASADSNVSNLFLSAHNIAARVAEHADAHLHLMGLPSAVTEAARAKGAAILARKIADAGERNDDLPQCDLLLPLGYDADSGVLGLQSLYETQEEWLVATVDYVLRHHPAIHMVVRQHPLEATIPSWENTELVDKLERAQIGTLHTMRAANQAPIYGLLRQAKAVVACQSTVVLEARALGIPSACMREAHYVRAGVVTRPPSRESYFSWLDDQLRGKPEIIPQNARDAALINYFVMQTSTTQPTRFTPHASDLWTWLHQDPANDIRSEIVNDILRCVVADVPLSLIKARRALGLPGLPDGVADPITA